MEEGLRGLVFDAASDGQRFELERIVDLGEGLVELLGKEDPRDGAVEGRVVAKGCDASVQQATGHELVFDRILE